MRRIRHHSGGAIAFRDGSVTNEVFAGYWCLPMIRE